MKMKRVRKNKFVKSNFDEEINELREKYNSFDVPAEDIKRFNQFPLSQKTLKGLSDGKFVHPTDIQRKSILPALQGKDVLGAAITGSGKTLAFLIPVLEHLYVNKWTRMDGVGAIIISPTRELAYQIFETLKKVGKRHDFSAGLIIGGKNVKYEKKRMDQCNILICTPGRLLQHMDENPLFNASSMQVLVLDEADRCLDMGFEKSVNSILENLSTERQTLLFSATQTDTVKELARLNLRNPVFVGGAGMDHKKLAVPELLQQSYVVVELEDKITMLWSFVKNHLKQKIIVFLSTCKQVKYVFEIFCKLRPGIALLALYGSLNQERRIAIYDDFVRKSNVVLFATDVASRGLDFPNVNWVVQLDCPEDVQQYIHRAGRSARNKMRGESLLVLTPNEEQAMLEELNKQQLKVQQIHIDPKKLFSPRAKMESYLAQNSELKASAQRAFVSYVKSVFLMKNKQIFQVTKINFDAFANSLGLAITPSIPFLERFIRNRKLPKLPAAMQFGSSNATAKDDSDSEDDFITIKRKNHQTQSDDDEANNANEQCEELLEIPKREKLLTKAALAKKAIKKKIQVNQKRQFDEEGKEIADARKQAQSAFAKEMEDKLDNVGGIDIGLAQHLLSEEDKFDKQRFREIVKQRHKQQKQKLKQRKNSESKSADDTDASDTAAAADVVEESDSEASVDLSWLPDPNKIYSKSQQTAASSDDEQEAITSDDEQLHNPEPMNKKRKITSKLSLSDMEFVAAQLLSKS